MTASILVQPTLWPEAQLPAAEPVKTSPSCKSLTLHDYWLRQDELPPSITASATIMRLLKLLGPLHWERLPGRGLKLSYRFPPIPYAALIAAELIRLNESIPSLKHLRRFLSEHSGFISLLGFPGLVGPQNRASFNTLPQLPTQRHLARMLRMIPNEVLQALLADSVDLIVQALHARGVRVGAGGIGECISLDTKHILAWVKQNNPKAYVADRFDKNKQPAGDPDCRLGCKRRHNRNRSDDRVNGSDSSRASSVPPPTPTGKPIAAPKASIGEYYWGYGSGVVVTKVPHYGEFVLAEMTQPFDHGDLTYFLPLMRQAEQRLGFKPRFGTFDAAFDAFYVYAYFYRTSAMSDGFAAVPFSEKGGKAVTDRKFSPDGLPICKADLPMPLKFTFTDRTSCLVEQGGRLRGHERGKYVCPLLHPTQTAKACPAHHKLWKHGGCTAMMPTSIGARLRYTLDRDTDLYKSIYNQRTAVERINSQAVALDIERPHLRNGAAIANQNTLIYLLINLRFLHRLGSDSDDA